MNQTDTLVGQQEFKDSSKTTTRENLTKPGGGLFFEGMTSSGLFGEWDEDFEEAIMPKWWEERVLDKKIKIIVSEVESEPRLLFSRDLLEELRSCMEITPGEFQDISSALDKLLDSFAMKRFEVSMDEKTKIFLKNELVYLILKLREESK